MSLWKKIGLTALFVPGMALMGLMTGLLIPMIPALTGVAVGLAAAAALAVGLPSGILGAVSYCCGTAGALMLFQSELLPLAAWLLALIGVALGMILYRLRRKSPVGRTMLYTGAVLFLFGMASYVACYLMMGDPVAYLAQLLRGEIENMAQSLPSLVDLLLSTFSVGGALPDVGLTQATVTLDPQTRRELIRSFVDVYDASLRTSLMQMLMQQALNGAFLGTLLPLLLCGKRCGDAISPMPDLARVRLPNRLSRNMMLVIVGMWIWMLLDDGAYAAYLAAWAAFKFVYAMQGLSVALWYMQKHDWARVLRGILLCIGFLFLQDLLCLLGIVEQMFYLRRIGLPDLRRYGLYRDDQRDEHGNPIPPEDDEDDNDDDDDHFDQD